MSRRTRPPKVIGLDLSLTASAAVALPAEWQPGDWNVSSVVSGRVLKEASTRMQLERISEIVDALTAFVVRELPTHVFVEDYAYGLAGNNGMRLAELGGAVKCAILDSLDIVVEPVNMSQVRKFFLGKLPPKDRAAVTHAALRSLGCPWEGSDLGDAILVANYGRTELGLVGMTLDSVQLRR